MNRSSILIGAAAAAIILGLSSAFIVDEREKVLVMQFGQVVRVEENPGLSFKLPFIQNLLRFDDRILPLATPQQEITPADGRRLVVETFARWRIVDAVRFRQAVGSEDQAVTRLGSILNAKVRQELGTVTSSSILSADRSALMSRIRDQARTDALSLGVEIVDVRIKSADLPDQNLAATFGRMEAERQREATDQRARGREAAQIIKAQADRQAVETVSAARKQSEIIRGEADAKRNAIYAEAYGRDPEFFAFWRSLAAYEAALTGGTSSLVLSPDSDFFEYLKSDQPNDTAAAAEAVATARPANPPAPEPAPAPAVEAPAPAAPVPEAPAVPAPEVPTPAAPAVQP